MVDDDRGGFRAGVIVADNFDGAAIPGAILFDNNNAVGGRFFRAEPREANGEHV
jgi:hypothetical protein